METTAKYEKYETEIALLGIREITESNLRLMREQILEIPAMPENREQYNTAKDMHIQAKKILPKIETRRKEIKAPHLDKCREVDATAKAAKCMIEPLIGMSGERRVAWETAREAEREAEHEKEQARLDDITNALEDLKEKVRACTKYGIDSKAIEARIEILSDVEISPEMYQERVESAIDIKTNGLLGAELALETRLKYEAEQAGLESQKKAIVEAREKIKAEQKAEAERLAKLAQVQKAEARKLAEEKAVLEAKKAAMAQAEADRIETARIEKRDRLWTEALPVHIWEYVYPVALDANRLFDEIRSQQMDAQAKRNMDIMRNRNAVDSMIRNILDAIEMARQVIDIPELSSFIDDFERTVKVAEDKLNQSITVLAE